jgi:hypothetical protein
VATAALAPGFDHGVRLPEPGPTGQQGGSRPPGTRSCRS